MKSYEEFTEEIALTNLIETYNQKAEMGLNEGIAQNIASGLSSPAFWIMQCAWGGCPLALMVMLGAKAAWNMWRQKHLVKKWERIQELIAQAPPEKIERLKKKIERIQNHKLMQRDYGAAGGFLSPGTLPKRLPWEMKR